MDFFFFEVTGLCICGCVWPFLQIVKYLQRKITKDKHLNNLLYLVREQSRNMRQSLASVILRLLGSRVVYEDADLSLYSTQSPPSKREAESLMEASTAASLDLSGESLFDRLLLVLHGLLSSCQPSWLKSKSASKSTTESIKEFSGFDREAAENLQVRFFVEIISLLMSIPLNSLDAIIGNCPISCIVLFFSLPFRTLCVHELFSSTFKS